MGIRLTDTQWGYLEKICGGESYTCMSVIRTRAASITLKRLSDVQDSYLLIYNNIEVEIHRYTEVDSTDMDYLRELCDSWICYNKDGNHIRKELD